MQSKLFKLSLLALCIGSAYAENNNELSYVDKMVSAIKYIQNNQYSVWPSFNVISQPIVTHFDSDENINVYAFNFNPLDKDWKKITVNDRQIYHMDKDKYDLKQISWGFQKIDGQKSFISNANTDNEPDKNVADTIKFRFYNFQHNEKSSPFPKDANEDQYWPTYAGMNDLYQVKLSYYELEALKAYLTATNNATKEENLKDAIIINNFRMQIADKESKRFETFMSRSWGLSSYVAWKSLNVANTAQYTHALDPVCNVDRTEKFDDSYMCLLSFRSDFLNVAYGLALDNKSHDNWKAEIEHSKRSIESILRELYLLPSDQVQSRVNFLIKSNKYNFEYIDQMVEKNLRPRILKINELMSGYEKDPGVEVRVNSYATYDDYLKANKSAKFTAKLPQLSAKFIDEIYLITNKLYVKANFSGQEWADGIKIKFSNAPYVFEHFGSDPKNCYSTFKVSEKTKMFIDGNETTVGDFMKNGGHQAFNHLVMMNNQIVLRDINKNKDYTYDLDGRSGSLVIRARN